MRDLQEDEQCLRGGAVSRTSLRRWASTTWLFSSTSESRFSSHTALFFPRRLAWLRWLLIVCAFISSPSMIDYWDETRTALMGVVEACGKYDRDGIDLYFSTFGSLASSQSR